MTDSYKFGLIGHHIAYSLSRDVFAAIFAVSGKRGRFEIYDVAPEQLDSRFNNVVAAGIQGLSVTIPHKQTIIGHLDEVDAVAQVLGAVNSVAVDSGHIRGFNTDCYGFSLALRPFKDQLARRRALVLGSGGAARAAIYCLCTDYQIRNFTVLSRSTASVTEFQTAATKIMPDVDIVAVTGDGIRNSFWDEQDYGIIVNCTPLGGWHYPDRSPLPAALQLHAGQIYYDVNYNDGNKLVQQARESGLTALDGRLMLVGQAVRSFAIWTTNSVAVEPVYEMVFGRKAAERQ
ncbi:MAG TPA: shikimate dehydrogenase [Candidatus Deferrimicrobium sp.]|nr:shikimate dehydrogenase [Candidatus Deferrimicrobium sp.]